MTPLRLKKKLTLLVVLIAFVIRYFHILRELLFLAEDRTYEDYLHISHSKDDPITHHKLLIDTHAEERIKATNSSHYTWLGKQWIPPPGIPIFTPKQMKEYYSQRNILVIGDTTSRRFYTTLFNILNATDMDNVALKEIDRDTFKGMNVCDADIGDRYITNMTEFLRICRNNTIDIEGVPAYDESTTSTTRHVKHFSLDQISGVCYAPVANFWRDSEEESDGSLNKDLAGFQQDYDLIIIATGIWDMVKEKSCKRMSPPGLSRQGRLLLLLDNLKRNNPDGMQVVFRTSGWDQKFYGRDEKLRDNNALTHKYFHDLDQQWELGRYEKNLTLVDWGGVMEKRSYNEDRIEGDISAHYGIEARLLFIQQLTHELVKSELITRDAFSTSSRSSQ